MNEKLKACALGCKDSIIQEVDKYIDLMSERGACQRVASDINAYAKAELYSAQNIRDCYRINKGLNKVVKSSPQPWTGQYETYTPQEYIESARIVMGSIDLDPASNKTANENVKATEYFDIGQDGLSRDWHGNVFLNPPYKQPEIRLFVDKLQYQLSKGNISQAILLTNNSTDTKWFHQASELSIICFPNHRIQFIVGDKRTQPTTGQAFFYFGDNKKGFKKEFSKYGIIFERSR